MASEAKKQAQKANAAHSRPGRRALKPSEEMRRIQADQMGKRLCHTTMRIITRRIARSERAELLIARIDRELTKNHLESARKDELKERRARLKDHVLTQMDMHYLTAHAHDRWGTPKRSQVEQLVDKIPPLMLVFPDGQQPPYAKYARPPQAEEEAATNVPH